MSGVREALILDFGGVISKTPFETHRESELALGLPKGALTWLGPFDPATDPLWMSMEADEISERDYWYARTRETGALLGEEWLELSTFLQRVRGDDPTAVIRPEALAAVRRVREAGLQLGILSNELDLFYGPDFREKLSILHDFDIIVDATYTKALKPNAEAYAFITQGLGLSASDCVFVDDQLRNVRGAQDVGMRAVHFDVKQPRQSFARALSLLGL